MKQAKKLTLPLLNTSIFAMVLMTLLIAISISLLLYNEYSSTIKKQQLEFSNNIADRSRQAVLKSVKNYQTILNDFTNFPLLRLAVMQPESNLEDAMDLTKSFSFLGDKFPIIVCDFEGKPLYDLFNAKPLTLEVYDSVKNANDFSITKNIEHNNKSMLLISSPIKVRDSVEGALCVLIPTEKLIIEALPKNDSSFMFEIYNGNKIISKTIQHHKNALKSSINLFDNVHLITYLDPSKLKTGQNKLFRKLFISIFFIVQCRLCRYSYST